MLYNLFLPGGIGGDGYKIYLLQKNYKTGTGKLFGAVLTDRLSGITALMILALILISLLDIPLPYHNLAFLVILVILPGLFYFMKIFYKYFTRIFIITLIFSLGVQLLQVLCAYFILTALGIHENILSYLLVFLVSSIVAMFPISIGGIGLRELTFLYGTQLLGIDQSIGVSTSLMFYVITAIVSFAGIYYVVRPVLSRVTNAR
jgi:uncharacterized membrane protein YbhN (UPF0104 family)